MNDQSKQNKIHPSQITNYHNFYLLSGAISWGLIFLAILLFIYSILWIKDTDQIIAVRIVNEVILLIAILSVTAFESSRDTYKAINRISFGGLKSYFEFSTAPKAEVVAYEPEIAPEKPLNLIEDIPKYIFEHRSVDKPLLLIGSTGDGKSTIAQWLANQCDEAKVYDPEATREDWINLSVFDTFEAIESEMKSDIGLIEELAQKRKDQGKTLFAKTQPRCFLIAEEYPSVANEIEISAHWLKLHARRGRKMKRILCIITQDDQVQSIGIEGQSQVLKNFLYIRLGDFAKKHARKVLKPEESEWLINQKYPCMLGDNPALLPTIKEGILQGAFGIVDLPTQNEYSCSLEKGNLEIENAVTSIFPNGKVTNQFQPVTNRLQDQETLKPSLAKLFPELSNPERQVEAAAQILALHPTGKSSFIIKNILGFQGRKYQKGKEVLQRMIDYLQEEK